MKYFLSLIAICFITACTTANVVEYRKQYPAINIQSDMDFSKAYPMLVDKITRCYAQADTGTGIVEKTTSELVPGKTKLGIIRHSVQSLIGTSMLFILDVTVIGKGTQVAAYSKGDAFRTTEELITNITQWLNGATVTCRGHGEI